MYQANTFSLQRLLLPEALCTGLSDGVGRRLGFRSTATVRVAPAPEHPRPSPTRLPPGAAVDETAVARIMAMGFQHDQAVQALRAAGNNVDAAVSRLL